MNCYQNWMQLFTRVKRGTNAVRQGELNPPSQVCKKPRCVRLFIPIRNAACNILVQGTNCPRSLLDRILFQMVLFFFLNFLWFCSFSNCGTLLIPGVKEKGCLDLVVCDAVDLIRAMFEWCARGCVWYVGQTAFDILVFQKEKPWNHENLSAHELQNKWKRTFLQQANK